MKVLVTGGVRSGKSRHAEALLAGATRVTYVAPGPSPEDDDDPDWAARIAAHRARRPASWTTLETRDLAGVLSANGPVLADRQVLFASLTTARDQMPVGSAVLVDCLGTWLTGILDERGLWTAPATEMADAVQSLLDEVVAALRARDAVVLVTNEVGLGVVPAHRSGRLFRDLLGTVNQQVAAACHEVHLVVSG
ncbi:MAG: bifunctional adenosylcobinamide kinase/adenosylcobinamide-phosphate guanylyltransferase, partial [Phycicoccus sp.]